MQVVLDIDENVFTRLFDNDTEDYAIVNDDLFAIAKAIRTGTQLPKGHGRLIDADVVTDGFEDNYELCIAVNATPTIIEADKAESKEFKI